MKGIIRFALWVMVLGMVAAAGATAVRAAQIPAGIVVSEGAKTYVAVTYFDGSQFSTSQVNSAMLLVQGALADMTFDGAVVTVVTPAMLGGFTAGSLHTLLVQNLSLFELYLKIDVSKISGLAGPAFRADSYLFLPGGGSEGTYVGSLEIPESLDPGLFLGLGVL